MFHKHAIPPAFSTRTCSFHCSPPRMRRANHKKWVLTQLSPKTTSIWCRSQKVQRLHALIILVLLSKLPSAKFSKFRFYFIFVETELNKRQFLKSFRFLQFLQFGFEKTKKAQSYKWEILNEIKAMKETVQNFKFLNFRIFLFSCGQLLLWRWQPKSWIKMLAGIRGEFAIFCHFYNNNYFTAFVQCSQFYAIFTIIG